MNKSVSLANKSYLLMLFFGMLKLLLHFLTNTTYGLHRDEYLYFDQGQHLAWGFYEVPPVTAFFGAFANSIGGGVFAIRLFPALAGVLIVLLSCKLVKDLGGGIGAIVITGLSLVLSPSLLGSNSLFQPVSFNQLCWFLIAYSVVQLIRKENKWDYYWLGIFIGIGVLTKYSVGFYLVALLLAVLLTKERFLLKTTLFLATLGSALVIAAPNLYWQATHGFPVITHMEELRETQLVHINWGDYLGGLLIAHKGFTLIWVAGLLGLFLQEKWRRYRVVGMAFLLTIVIVGSLQGKPYYVLGAFLILFPFGGLFLEWLLEKVSYRYALVGIAFLITLPFYPLSLPLLKVDALKKYTHYLSTAHGINYMLRWEDDQYYDLPQDVADRFGWEELAQRVARIYHALPKEQQEQCLIIGGSYGHAGSLNYFRKQYDLPVVYSLNGSYAYWAEAVVDHDRQILIDDRKQEESDWFAEMILADSVQNKYAREPGYIYYRTAPKVEVVEAWKELVEEVRGE